MNVNTLLSLVMVGVVIMAASALSSCTTGEPKSYKINGVTRVHTPKKICGVTYWTSTEEVKTKEQQLDDLEVDKERREQELDLQAEERQAATVFWFGTICMSCALACVIAGYLLKGWRFWGGLAALLAVIGTLSWSFEHLIPHLKWVAYGIGGVAVAWTMWKVKDFSLKEWIDKRKQGGEDAEGIQNEPSRTN